MGGLRQKRSPPSIGALIGKDILPGARGKGATGWSTKTCREVGLPPRDAARLSLRSTANRGHGDRRFRPRVAQREVMALGLLLERRANQTFEIVDRGPGAKRRAQVDSRLAEQAQAQLAGRRHAHAVAARAEGVGKGRDEADPAAGARQAKIARGPGERLAWLLGERAEFGFETGPDLLGRNVERPLLLGVLPHRHDFDETHRPAL